MRTNLDNIKGARVLIVGLGKSGIAAAQAMIRLGADVSIQDGKREDQLDPSLLAFFAGKGVTGWFDKVPEDMGAYDLLILSPGVSPELPFIQEAKDAGVEVIGELEIAYRVGQGNYVAITGTNGKTTTTTLTGEIFQAAGRRTSIVGNIGVAVISAALDAKAEDWLVTEVSSFQLETTRYFKPQISAILNLTPDHLNRHHTMEAYGAAKAKVFANQTADGYLVINQDDPACFALGKDAGCKIVPFSRKEKLPFGAYVEKDQIVIADEKGIHPICSLKDIPLPGAHNVENVLAAAAISYFAGIAPEVIGKTIAGFGGVEHRIEYCGQMDGVRYYNDSKGTNTDATITAIRALEKNLILIAGGDGKGQDFTPLAKVLPGAVKKLILLGRDGQIIGKAAQEAGFQELEYAKDMDACVRRACEVAEPGDVVLLSPACASWDMYDNFEQRGDHFKECVHRLGV